jgi:hypothetical protein
VQTSSSQVNASSGGEFVGYGDNNNHRFALADGGGTAGLEIESAALAVPFSPDGNWHQFVATLPSGSTDANALLYKDGAAQSPRVVNGGFTINTNNTELSLGRIPTVNFTGYYIGSLDEVRISNIARSSDWIATEYANQSSPSTFFTVLPANTINVLVEPPSASLTGGQTQQFVSVVTGSCNNTSVTWSVPANQGMITAAGLYTAPATITSAQTVTVTATSAANSAITGTASVNLIPSVTNSVSPATAILTQGQARVGRRFRSCNRTRRGRPRERGRR